MFLLTNTFDGKFEYEGETYHVDMSFDNILRLFDLFEDDFFTIYEKIPIALEMLIVEYDKLELDLLEANELYNYLLKEFLWLEDEEGEGKKVLDFRKDAGVIYASFMAEYGMDLFEQKGRLHWHKFSELLSGLSDESAFKKVVGYRMMEIPSSKTASKEYRKHIREMKKIHSIEEEKTTVDMEDKLDSIASVFASK